MACAALLLAAGRSSRMEGFTEDKILAPLAGHAVFDYSLLSFAQSKLIGEVVIVYRDEEQRAQLQARIDQLELPSWNLCWVLGGKDRQDSVFNGLAEVSLLNNYVFIHDCARPLIRPETLRRLHELVQKDKAACAAHPVADTIKHVTCSNLEMRVCELKDMDRKHLWAMETPQVFALDLILECYRRLRLDNLRVTDDTAALANSGHGITLLHTPYPNPKLTTPADWPYAEFLLKEKQTL